MNLNKKYTRQLDFLFDQGLTEFKSEVGTMLMPNGEYCIYHQQDDQTKMALCLGANGVIYDIALCDIENLQRLENGQRSGAYRIRDFNDRKIRLHKNR